MSDLTIITNNLARDLVALVDLPKKARQDFVYIMGDEAYSPRFFRYKGEWYDIDEFERINPRSVELSKWHGIKPDSFFSGILIRLPYDDNFDSVVVGRYYT